MLDFDLARVYGVETKSLNRAVKRNVDRFPKDFVFQISSREWENLKYQTGTSRSGHGVVVAGLTRSLSMVQLWLQTFSTVQERCR
jgi:hypothetical protein